MLCDRVALRQSRMILTFVCWILRRHHASIGSPWRTLIPGQQALRVLL